MGWAWDYFQSCNNGPSFSVLLVSSQDILNGDDLYPAEASYWITTDQSPVIHHPRCPTLRDKVSLHVRYHKGYEYECPTHTAEELEQLTTRHCRLEIHSPRDFKFFDNIISKKVDDHMERYTAARKSLKSRLWSLFWVTYILCTQVYSSPL